MPDTLMSTSLTLAGAQRLLTHASAAARAQSVAQAFAIVDPAGHLLAFARMDGCGLVSIDVAVGKARTAALLGKPSQAFEEMIDAGATSMVTVPGIVPLRGGLPVEVDGAIVGALGVSGATGDVDDAVGRAALAAWAEEAAR